MPEIYSNSHKPTKKSSSSNKKSKIASSENTHHEVDMNRLKKIAHANSNPLAAFMYFPKKANFVGTDREEKILLVLRRHPITNVRWVVTGIIMILVPLFISFIPEATALPLGYQLIAMMTWYLITLAFLIEQFLGWYFNVHIVTDERVFDVDFVHLIHREITDANIDQIQDVTVQVSGVFQTMFDYGNVLIQTAAEKAMIEYVSVPQPDKVAQILRELRVQEEIEKLEGRVR